MKRSDQQGASRREFLAAGAGVGAAAVLAGQGVARAAEPASAPETTVKQLYETLKPEQRQAICFDWDYVDPRRGLLRTRVANNWQVTSQPLSSDFYTGEQRKLVREIFEGLIHPDWHGRVDKQLQDDAGGWGKRQSIAIFGQPGSGKFEFVLTGRHMTLRCDGDSADHVAFGGPIFYGHAAQGFNEKPNHPGNVYWPQAVEANKVFEMLDGKQRKVALAKKQPAESRVGFQGADGEFAGIPVADLSSDQREQVQKTLQKLIEPYRQSDKDEVVSCLKAQGGLDKCHLAFFQDGDLGNDGVWDVWRLEGPSFVWHFRGEPHVHVWVNVASDSSVKLNA